MSRVASTSRLVPPPAAHGGDGPAVAAALGLDPGRVLDLSLSLNPVAPDPVPVLERHLRSVDSYPDPARATAALAGAMGVDVDQILLTNGGAEAIRLVGDEIGGRVDEPEFALFPRGGGLRWRSNPHSPDGRLAPDDEYADVWDEAFYPLAAGRWTRGDPDSLVVGSLTKLLACPGLRVGYVLAPAHLRGVLDRVRQRQPAWSVNGLVASALPDLLADVQLSSWSASVAALRTELVTLLRAHGLDPWPSNANWVLVDCPALRERLAPLGVVVRDCASFGLPGTMRIAVPSSRGLEQLADALVTCEKGSPWPP